MPDKIINRTVWVLILLLSTACGSSAREKALSTTLASLNAARDGFVAWDKEHQESIVQETYDEGGTRADAVRKLADYRRKAARIDQAFVLAYSALAAAALDLSVAGLISAAADARKVYEAILALKGDDS